MPWREEFDGVWTCASLLHVPATELPRLLRRLQAALRPGGLIYMSFIGVAETGDWRLALSPQRGEFANEAIFVTHGDAAQPISVACITGPIAKFALMTDAVEPLAVKTATEEPHARFFEYVFAGLRAAPTPGPDTSHKAWLEAFLAAPRACARADDDKTMVLCSKHSAA